MPDEIDHRFRAIEEKLARYAEVGWVRDFVQPVRDSVVKMEVSVASLTHTVSEIAADVRKVFDAHDQLLRDRANQERQLYEEKLAAMRAEKEAVVSSAKQNSLMAVLKDKWMPILSFITLMAAALAILGKVVESLWVKK